MASQRSSQSKTKKKVPQAKKEVDVVHLRCTNCGEEDTRVIYCPECDAPMVVAEVKKKGEDEVENDDSVTKDNTDDADDSEVEDDVSSDPDVDVVIQNGLSDIFPGGDSGGAGGVIGEEGGVEDLDEIVDILDQEE